MTLEHRYRRLLRLFPQHHRHRFTEEMVTTLMDGAGSHQRYPRLRETADLLWNAAWLRLTRKGVPRARDPRWADAAAIAGVLGPLFLFAGHVGERLADIFRDLRMPRTRGFDASSWQFLPWQYLALGVSWLVVAALALLGWRVVAAGAAWMAALMHLGYRLFYYFDNPTLLTTDWAVIAGSFTVAICLTIRGPKHRARQLLGGPLSTLTFAVLTLFAVSGYVDSLLLQITVHGDGDGTFVSGYGDFFFIPGLPSGLASMILIGVATAVMIAVLIKTQRAVRRRLLAIALPVLVLMVVMDVSYAGFESSSQHFWPAPVLLTIPQWLFMVLLPMLIFAIGVLMVRRADDREQLMELGRIELARQRDSDSASA